MLRDLSKKARRYCFLCIWWTSLVGIFALFSHEIVHYSLTDLFDTRGLRESNQSTRSNWEHTLSFERRLSCNYRNRQPCYSTNKSLVATFWSARSMDKWMVENILAAFPVHSFDHMIFVHDNSSWIQHPGYQTFIWIHVADQLRFWYLKRFVTPTTIEPYQFLWIIDDDAKLFFRPLDYQCVVRNLSIPLSAPSRLSGPLSHGITRTNYDFKDQLGRWVDFVETGPVVILSSAAWQCIYRYLDASTGTGWGLDLIWCNIIRQKCSSFFTVTYARTCAILDAFGVHHESVGMYSFDDGLPELEAYNQAHKALVAKRENLGALAENSQLFDACRNVLLSI